MAKEEFIEAVVRMCKLNTAERIVIEMDLDRLIQAERGRFLQEKLEGYDVGSLEYKIIESMLKED